MLVEVPGMCVSSIEAHIYIYKRRLQHDKFKGTNKIWDFGKKVSGGGFGVAVLTVRYHIKEK
jgi:hypothetical protein